METATGIKAQAAKLEPLCKATEWLLKPLELWETDRLHLCLDDEGKNFIASPFYVEPATWCSHNANSKWFHRVPEKIYLSHLNKWSLAGTDISALVISHMWPVDQVEFDDDARILFDFLLTRFMAQSASCMDRARYLVADSHMRKWFKKEYVDNWYHLDCANHPLATYQKVGLHTSMRQECFGMFMEQGTGKTPLAISRMMNECYLWHKKKRKHPYRIIVVAPKNVRTNWRYEFQKFATLTGRVTVLRGGALERVKQLVDAMDNTDPDVKWTAVVCSYETLQRSWEAIGMCEWEMGVLDESHYIKSPRAKRSKAALMLRDNCSMRMALTGTPFTNSILDLWCQLEWLGEGMSGFSTWKKFQSYYCDIVKVNNMNFFKGYQNLPILQERLSRICYIVTKEQALPDLPKKLTDVHEVSMTLEQVEIYTKVAKQLAVECKNDMDSSQNKSLVVNNILTKLLRLAQITSGYVVWDPIYDFDDAGEPILVRDKIIDRFDPDPKLESLIDLLRGEANPYSKAIIWSCWVQNIKTIAARLAIEFGDQSVVSYYGGTSDEDRELAVKRFNSDPDCKYFIGNPAAGGTGINLLGYDPVEDPNSEYNCDHVIYYSQNWSMTARSQSEDRAHRRGTRMPVRYTDLCVANTIDEEIRERVCAKRMTAYNVQDIADVMRQILSAMPQANGDN